MVKWVSAAAAGSACFEFIDRTDPLVHLCGSEYTAFPEIGIRNALAARPALTCAGRLARSRIAHGPMHGEVSWGDTATSVPGRPHEGPQYILSPNRL